jgi:hypothetical protein
MFCLASKLVIIITHYFIENVIYSSLHHQHSICDSHKKREAERFKKGERSRLHYENVAQDKMGEDKGSGKDGESKRASDRGVVNSRST